MSHSEFIEQYLGDKILHIGGHLAQENYTKDVLYVEPVKEYAEVIKSKGYKVLNTAIGEPIERDFYVDENGVSSFLKHPVEQIIKRVEKITPTPLKEVEVGFDTLIVDTEGTTLEVLKSGSLEGFKIIICELRHIPVFDGEVSRKEIEEYLSQKGFIVIDEIKNTPAPHSSCDVVFKKV